MPATRASTTTTAGLPPATPAHASLYQQARGHLAELKMHDAAEALLGALDVATAEGLNMTATLERPFAIEVSATRSPAPGRAAALRLAAHPGPPWTTSTTRPRQPCRGSSSLSAECVPKTPLRLGVW